MILASSFSGGKDSMLACYHALKSGHTIKFLLNLQSRKYKRSCFHGIQSTIINDQADALGIPIIRKEMSEDSDEYEREFTETLKDLKRKGIQGAVFGDIYLDGHREWVERMCGKCDITAYEPLWGMDPEQIFKDFLAIGFKAIIISCKEELGKEFIGKPLDLEVMEELKNRGMCVCGENGEYHTLVTDGPLFNQRIRILKAKPILREGFWKHWVFAIEQYIMEKK
jgi:diphthine-ammonia ligase